MAFRTSWREGDKLIVVSIIIEIRDAKSKEIREVWHAGTSSWVIAKKLL